MTTDNQVYCSVVWSPPKMFFWTITILFADKTGAEENRTSLFGAARLWHLEPSSTQNQNPEVLDGWTLSLPLRIWQEKHYETKTFIHCVRTEVGQSQEIFWWGYFRARPRARLPLRCIIEVGRSLSGLLISTRITIQKWIKMTWKERVDHPQGIMPLLFISVAVLPE